MTQEQFDEKVKTFLKNYIQITGPAQAVTDAGAAYVEITNVRVGDTPVDIWHMSFDNAWSHWAAQMTGYLYGKSHIVWRIKPEFDSQTVYDLAWDAPMATANPSLRPHKRWRIYARLFAY